jgi:hypothetical protein
VFTRGSRLDENVIQVFPLVGEVANEVLMRKNPGENECACAKKIRVRVLNQRANFRAETTPKPSQAIFSRQNFFNVALSLRFTIHRNAGLTGGAPTGHMFRR